MADGRFAIGTKSSEEMIDDCIMQISDLKDMDGN